MTDRETYQSLSQFYYEELDNILRISGVMLAPGIWKGTIYAAEQIKALYEKFKEHLMNMPLVVEHFRHPGYLGRVVGRHTNIKYDPKTSSILYQAEVTDPEAIRDIKADQFVGTSVANWVDFQPGPDGIHATNLTPINNSLTASPACKKCVIKNVKEMSEEDRERSIAYYGMFPLSEVLNSLSQKDEKPMSCTCPYMDLSLAKEAQELSVIPFAPHTKAPEGEAWNFASSDYSLEQLKMACTVIVGDPKVKESYKLPHHKPSGAVVWHGVHSAMAALKGARGGTHMPSSDVGGAKAHLLKHYKQFDKKPSGDLSTEDVEAALMEVLSIGLDLTEVDNMSEPKPQEPAVVQSTTTTSANTVPTVTNTVTAPVSTTTVVPTVTTPPTTIPVPSTPPVQPANVPSQEPVPIVAKPTAPMITEEAIMKMVNTAVEAALKSKLPPPVAPSTTPPAEPVVKPTEPATTTPNTPPAEPALPAKTRQEIVDEIVKSNKDDLLDLAAGILVEREQVEEKWK